jgi:hypothetical protein
MANKRSQSPSLSPIRAVKPSEGDGWATFAKRIKLDPKGKTLPKNSSVLIKNELVRNENEYTPNKTEVINKALLTSHHESRTPIILLTPENLPWKKLFCPEYNQIMNGNQIINGNQILNDKQQAAKTNNFLIEKTQTWNNSNTTNSNTDNVIPNHHSNDNHNNSAIIENTVLNSNSNVNLNNSKLTKCGRVKKKTGPKSTKQGSNIKNKNDASTEDWRDLIQKEEKKEKEKKENVLRQKKKLGRPKLAPEILQARHRARQELAAQKRQKLKLEKKQISHAPEKQIKFEVDGLESKNNKEILNKSNNNNNEHHKNDKNDKNDNNKNDSNEHNLNHSDNNNNNDNNNNKDQDKIKNTECFINNKSSLTKIPSVFFPEQKFLFKLNKPNMFNMFHSTLLPPSSTELQTSATLEKTIQFLKDSHVQNPDHLAQLLDANHVDVEAIHLMVVSQFTFIGVPIGDAVKIVFYAKSLIK